MAAPDQLGVVHVEVPAEIKTKLFQFPTFTGIFLLPLPVDGHGRKEQLLHEDVPREREVDDRAEAEV